MGFPRIIIHNDSQVVVNATNGKKGIRKDIINLMEDIRCLLTHVKDARLEYYIRITNRNVDALS